MSPINHHYPRSLTKFTRSVCFVCGGIAVASLILLIIGLFQTDKTSEQLWNIAKFGFGMSLISFTAWTANSFKYSE